MSAAAIDALVCSVEGSLPLATLSAASVGRDEVVYRLDLNEFQGASALLD